MPSSREQTFGRYVLEERVAMGGMAEIFRARLEKDGFSKTLCIKRILPHILSADDEMRQRFIEMFKREAAIAARLTHPNIVQVFDFGDVDGRLFLAMEYVEGFDLRDLIGHFARLDADIPIPLVIMVFKAIAEALHAAHSLVTDDTSGIVHRDVSPHNILIDRNGQIKLTDFGIAKSLGEFSETRTGLLKGKLRYLAPEQARGDEIGPASDQFSLGIIVWEMLVGRRLYRGGSDAEILYKVVHSEAESPRLHRADIPEALEHIVLRMLSLQPEERFDDMQAVIEAIHDYIDLAEIRHAQLTMRPYIDAYFEEQQARQSPPQTLVQVKETPMSQTGALPDVGQTLTLDQSPERNADESDAIVDAPETDTASMSPESVAPPRQEVETERVERRKNVGRIPAPMVRALLAGGVLLGMMFFLSGRAELKGNHLVPTPASVQLNLGKVEPAHNSLKQPITDAPIEDHVDADHVVETQLDHLDEEESGQEEISPKIDPNQKAQDRSKRRAGSRYPVKMSFAEKGWAYVYWKGKRLGELPGVFELPVGTLSVELRKPGYQSRLEQIRVRAHGHNQVAFQSLKKE